MNKGTGLPAKQALIYMNGYLNSIIGKRYRGLQLDISIFWPGDDEPQIGGLIWLMFGKHGGRFRIVDIGVEFDPTNHFVLTVFYYPEGGKNE